MRKLTLTYLDRDDRSRPVYKDGHGKLYVDVEPRAGKTPKICTKYKNLFEGEPDIPVNAEITFIPSRSTW